MAERGSLPPIEHSNSSNINPSRVLRENGATLANRLHLWAESTLFAVSGLTLTLNKLRTVLHVQGLCCPRNSKEAFIPPRGPGAGSAPPRAALAGQLPETEP